MEVKDWQIICVCTCIALLLVILNFKLNYDGLKEEYKSCMDELHDGDVVGDELPTPLSFNASKLNDYVIEVKNGDE